MARFRGINKDGKQCTNNAIKGKTYCAIEAHKTNQINPAKRLVKRLLILIVLPLTIGGIYYSLGPSKQNLKQVDTSVKSEGEKTRKVLMEEMDKMRTTFKRHLSQNFPKEDKKPPLGIMYQYQSNIVSILFMNRGDSPIQYFTTDIKIKGNKGKFKLSNVHADFPISCPEKEGNWTVINGRDMPPGKFAFVTLEFIEDGSKLEDPVVKSDSDHKYYGFTTLKWGEEENYEDYKAKQKGN